MNLSVPKHALLALAVLTLATLACSFGNPPLAETPKPELSPTHSTQPENNDQGLCANTLIPVKPGATWTYKSSGSFSGD